MSSRLVSIFINLWAVVVVQGLAESTLVQEVEGSIPGPSKLITRKPAILKLFGVRVLRKRMKTLTMI